MPDIKYEEMEYFQIKTARSHWKMDLQDRLREVILPRAVEKGVPVEKIAKIVASRKKALIAEINHSRWIVRCPECPSAELAPYESGLFMCQNSWNVKDGFKWRRVAFPPERKAIEAALSRRLLEEKRNWVPGESVEELIRENKEHKGEVI